jgi:retron-type reverse transcriptase
MTIYMQADLYGGKMYHAHGRKHTNAVAGKPDAVKAARPVWWGAHGTGPSPRWYLAGCLPNGDISKCFDRLDHQVLLSILQEKIHDEPFIRLISELLEAGYLEEWKFHATLSGTPQGGVLSPLLANIYLDRLDTYVEQELIPEYTKGEKRKRNPAYHKLGTGVYRLRKQGRMEEAKLLRQQMQQLPCQDPEDPDFRRLKYVRYADDFLLGLYVRYHLERSGR